MRDSKREVSGSRLRGMRLATGVGLVCLMMSSAWGQRVPHSSQSARGPLRTVTLGGRLVGYRVVGQWAVADGDIIIGTAAEIAAAAKSSTAAVPRAAATLFAGSGNVGRWPNSTLVYTIQPNFPNAQRITDAIAHWTSNTSMKFTQRVAETTYIQFTGGSDSDGCYTEGVGMQGGLQRIVLSSACDTGAVIHEIGHAFGLYHEQTRLDRSAWVTIEWENVDDYDFQQFSQATPEKDLGYYDYDSIMQYPADAFSVDGGTSMETVPPAIPIGQRVGLSAGDIDAITRMYGTTPTNTVVTTIPTGLTFLADGQRYTAPHAFAWAQGSAHTIAADAQQNSGTGTSTIHNVFARWSDGGDVSHTFVASSSTTVVAAEYQQYFPVRGLVVGNGTVTVEPVTADGYYLGGTMVTIRATAAAGSQLYTWRGNNPEYWGYGFSAEVMQIPVRDPLVFQGEFRSAQMVTLAANPPGGELYVDGTAYYTPVRFDWTAGTTHQLEVRGATYSPTGAIRWNFSGWDDGSISTSRTIAAGTTSYTADFTTQNFLNWDWYGSGTVSAQPSTDDYYDAGTTVMLIAAPRPTQTLQYWLGAGRDATGDPLTRMVVMDRPRFSYGVFGQALNFRPVNAASYLGNSIFDQPGTNVAPLEIVTLFGSGLGPAKLATGVLDSSGRLASSLAGYRVLFDGVPAPIVYASDKQTSVVVPAEVSGRVYTAISVEANGAVTSLTTAGVVPAIGGIFTSDQSGTGQAAALNQDYSLNSPSNPAAAGSVITLYATGVGLMDRSVPNGTVTDANLLRPSLPVYARIGNLPADVVYAGSSPGIVNGGLQVNVRVPAGLAPGSQPVKLVFGTVDSAPGTTVSVK